MRKVGLVFALVVVVFACSSGSDMLGEILDSGVPDAGAESPGDGTSMQYLGNSTKTFIGERLLRDENNNEVRDEYGIQVKTGIFEYYAACQETFGPGTRTCTEDEIRFTTKIPQVEGYAWYGIDAACSDNTNRRPAVTSTGGFTTVPCSATPLPEIPSACCGPK